MSALGHCLLTIFLRKSLPSKPVKKRFFFEAMCTRDERCKELIETTWDPLNGNLEFRIQDRLKSCQVHLQNWNRRVFWKREQSPKTKAKSTITTGISKLAPQNSWGDPSSKKENLWSALSGRRWCGTRKSCALWIKCGDRNTKFFHAMANQRRKKNKIEGLWDSKGVW